MRWRTGDVEGGAQEIVVDEGLGVEAQQTRARGDRLLYCHMLYSRTMCCLLLDRHRKCVGCDVNCKPLNAAKTDPVIAFDSQVLDPKSEISGSGEMKPTHR